MKDYGTLSQTINALKEEGYTLDFNIGEECLVCHITKTTLSPDEFEIDHVFRFEGDSNPDDQSILYAISSTINPAKGLLVNGYGISAEIVTNAMIAKLQTHPNIKR